MKRKVGFFLLILLLVIPSVILAEKRSKTWEESVLGKMYDGLRIEYIIKEMNRVQVTPSFVAGYPRLQDKTKYGEIGIEISTNIPATVYYMLSANDTDGVPAPLAVNNRLVQTETARKAVKCNISGEIGEVYTIFLVAQTPDGRRSNVVKLENVTPCPYPEGDGSVSSPYAIHTADQLDFVRYFPNKAFILKNDIRLSGEWEPISEFYGKFDGNGHRIEGLYIDTDKKYAGLFGKIVKGEVKNLSVEGTVRAKSNVGIFAGELLDAKVTSCVAEGTVEALSGNAGGFFGESAGRITNCLSSVYIVEADSFAGGICGQNYGIIENSISAVHTVMANMYAGGVASVNQSGGRIERCVAVNINVYDVIMDNCGRITANKQDGECNGNYAYADMRTNAQSGVYEHLGNNGADIGWEEIISRDALCEIVGLDPTLWEGGSKSEEYLIPHPSGATAPRLTKGVCEYAPLRISRATELLQVIENTDMHYLLVSDIVFTPNLTWTPAGDTLSEEEGFSGTFDGNGHTIYGLNIKRSENGLCGMFGMISGGSVRDLTLSDITLTGGDVIGAVSAISYGDIIGCRVENMTVKTEEAGAYIGGICGYNYKNVLDCHTEGNINSDVKNVVVGGICAHNEGFVYIASFSGNITTIREMGICESVAGGICGYNAGGMIYNATAKANFSQKAGIVYTGGVCAIQNGGEIYMCSADGFINSNSIDGTSVSYVGGVCALASGGILMHTYSTADIIQYAPRSYAGGICAYNEGAVVQNGYSTSSVLQEMPSNAQTGTAYAGGVCGYNDGGILASLVALNKKIYSFGTTGRICATGNGDSIYDNYTIPYPITQEGETTFGGEVIAEASYDFFTKPIAEGGKLGWAKEVWQDGGKYPVF